jgi:hypothetical protein
VKPRSVSVDEAWWNQIKPGDRLTWMYTPRGGWGYSYPVDAEVIKVNAETVSIRAKKKDGAEIVRQVRPENLRKKSA